MSFPKIEVSTEVKAAVEKVAKAYCDEKKQKYDAFNQDANAITAFRVLKEEGFFDAEMSDEDKLKALRILKKMGNASALRQAIAGEATTKASTMVAEELMADV